MSFNYEFYKKGQRNMSNNDKTIQFGENVDGYNIPVLNEREIRAAAGILFVFLFVAFVQAVANADMLLLKYFIVIFLIDILIRVFINPKFAPTLIIGRYIVNNQKPEYVGAPQKLFAWKIGLFLASLMFLLVVLLNTFSIISGLSCMICLLFIFFETSFGICLGCKFYKWRYKEEAQYCPGEVCERKDRQETQKTSLGQWMIVLAMSAFIALFVLFYNDTLNQPPTELFEYLETVL